jgi:hypothetical protein
MAMSHLIRISLVVIVLSFLFGTACAKPWTPPRDRTPPPPTIIYLRTPQGLVPMNSKEAAALDQTSFERQFAGGRDVPPPLSVTQSLSGSQAPPLAAPIQPQYYYVRPEHTSTGYIEGHYGRIDNYTPGEHTSTGYIEGHYRGDGLYTQPEHTSTGYIPGHYRAETLPNGSSMIGVQPSTAPPPYRAK